MNIQNMKTDEVKPYPNNPRQNGDAVEKVANSLKEFGWQQPIVVDKNNVVIVGHTRLRAAKRLGYEEVPVIVADNLSDEQVKAYRLADNKVAEFSIWEDDLLAAELSGIDQLDMGNFGFDLSFEIDELIDDDVEEEPEVKFTEELLEENNYIVLKFDNEVDWLQAQTLFELEKVKALHSKPNFEASGTGRVVDGAAALNRIWG